jgi:hypothetical protein
MRIKLYNDIQFNNPRQLIVKFLGSLQRWHSRRMMGTSQKLVRDLNCYRNRRYGFEGD